MSNYLSIPLIALASVCFIMVIIFLWAKSIKNNGIVDIFWAFNFTVIAAVIWHFSKTGNILCYEYSLIQGHAVWHILDALALYFLFRYYVSEKENRYGK